MSADRKRPLLRLADDLTVLTRLIHAAGAARRSELEPMPPDGLYGSLSELRTALLAGRVDRTGALAIYRYHPATEAAWSRLAADGWITIDTTSLQGHELAKALCRRVLGVHDDVATEAWGEPTALLELTAGIVAEADETGPAFGVWRRAGHDCAATIAGRLFLMLSALRYLRADAHAAAWQAAGHTAESIVALEPSSPARIAIEDDTDARHAAALRRVSQGDIDTMIAGVALLADER